jgi:outer membrane protein OmpA-like peptidoglycan-associated protein
MSDMSTKLFRWAAFGSIGSLGLALSCGAAQHGSSACGPWSGLCSLVSVSKVRTVERFPRSFVVLEAVYRPETGGAGSAPPPIRHEVTAEAQFEPQLREHLERLRVVECRTPEPPPEVCETPVVALALPEFRPTAAVEQTGPAGCADVERAAGTTGTSQGQTLGELLFAEHSPALDAPLQAEIDRIAALLKSDTRIQCAAIGGNVSYGESLELANLRARAVLEALLARGVERPRLVLFEMSVPLYADTPPQERVSMPDHRKVKVAVVLFVEGARR